MSKKYRFRFHPLTPPTQPALFRRRRPQESRVFRAQHHATTASHVSPTRRWEKKNRCRPLRSIKSIALPRLPIALAPPPSRYKRQGSPRRPHPFPQHQARAKSNTSQGSKRPAATQEEKPAVVWIHRLTWPWRRQRRARAGGSRWPAGC
jgi:hypothetical protein